MTDNEIIKALECSVKNKCPECPYFHSYPCDRCKKMQKDALDLINRYEAENINLKGHLEQLKSRYDNAHAEIERLQGENLMLSQSRITLPERIQLVNNARAEAIKEFAERLTDKAELVRVNAFDSKWAIGDDDIDNLVKEMVGK